MTKVKQDERRKMVTFLKSALNVNVKMLTSMGFKNFEDLYKKEMKTLQRDIERRDELERKLKAQHEVQNLFLKKKKREKKMLKNKHKELISKHGRMLSLLKSCKRSWIEMCNQKKKPKQHLLNLPLLKNISSKERRWQPRRVQEQRKQEQNQRKKKKRKKKKRKLRLRKKKLKNINRKKDKLNQIMKEIKKKIH